MHEICNIENALGTLINESGKLRMLSHRVVMFLALHVVNPADNSQIKSAEKAFDRFRSIIILLQNGDTSQGIEPTLTEKLKGEQAVSHAMTLSARFLENARPLLNPDQGRYAETVDRLSTFVSGELLGALNTLNDTIRGILDNVIVTKTTQEQADRAAFASNIQNKISDINSQIKLVSINAQIEAVRTGPEGAAFRVIASEISALSDLSTRVLNEFTTQHRSGS